MQAVGPSPRHPPVAARIYGIRLLYLPRGRRRVALAFAVLAVLDYLKEAVGHLSSMDHRPLEFDFGQFQRAAQDLSDGRNPYDAYLGLHCHNWCLGGYIYSPLLAELLRPIAHLPLPRAATIWLLVTHAMVFGTVVLLWRLLRGRASTTAILTMLGFGLLFQPLYENISYVQVGVLILLVLAGAAALHLRERPSANAGAGALVGLAAVFKVTPLLMAPALLPVGWALRGVSGKARDVREGLAGWAGLAVSVAALVALMMLFVPHTADFFTQVLPHIGGGTAVYENKSLPAMVARVFNTAALLSGANVPEDAVLGPDSKVVTIVATVLFLGPVFALAARLRASDGQGWQARAAAFAAYVAAMPIVSTITWRHHVVVNLLAMSLLLPALWPVTGPPANRAARWLLVASYPLMFIPQDIANNLAHSGGWDVHGVGYAARYVTVQDLNLLGMVMLWLAACLTLRGLGRARAGADIRPAGSLRPVTEGA